MKSDKRKRPPKTPAPTLANSSKILRQCDIFWFSLSGYITDLERLDFVWEDRHLFTKEGLIKHNLSSFPWADRELKLIARRYGGWKALMKPDFQPSDQLLSELESAGFTRSEFEHSRIYNDPSALHELILKRRSGKTT
jgi:hypothetical protein